MYKLEIENFTVNFVGVYSINVSIYGPNAINALIPSSFFMFSTK